MNIKTLVIFSATMFILCGFLFPMAVTGVSQLAFDKQANGSIIYINDKPVGSVLLGQNFSDSRFMKGRPSAVGYNTYTKEEKDDGSYSGVSSGSNNYAPTNPKLKERVEADMEKFLATNPNVKKGEIPADILTASGSGLDPHISVQSAALQVPSLSESTGLSEQTINDIIKKHTSGKWLGIFGNQTVNVLNVNIDIAKAIGLI